MQEKQENCDFWVSWGAAGVTSAENVQVIPHPSKQHTHKHTHGKNNKHMHTVKYL